jgi:hypothetical protein
MSSRAFPLPPSSPHRPFPSPPRHPVGARRVLLALFLPIAAVFALPSLGIGALIWWRASKTWDSRERWSGTWLMAIVGLLVYGCLTWFDHPLPSLFHSLSVDLSHLSAEPRSLVTGLRWLGLLWLLHLCFAPTCALILEGLLPLSRRVHLLPRAAAREPGMVRVDGFVHPATLPRSSQTGQRQAFASSVLSPVESAATGELSAAQASPLEPLGIYLGGELDEWVYGGQLCIPAEALSLHGVVLGEPGFGKTITLLRLATIAARYGMQVIFLDLKGSQRTAAQFVAAMRFAGLERIKVFPREAYDGWRGDANAIYNRLLALADPGIHPYYARVDSTLVSLAVHAPCGPPRSSRDFLLRLNAGWLKRAYAGTQHWYEQRTIRKVQPHIDATSLAYDGFFGAASGGLDGTFACEDGDAVYIGLDGNALREQAASIGRYVLEDCAHYATSRKPVSLRTLTIIDEFGVLKTSNATNLFERVREAGMAMWASAQSFYGLGAERASVLSASSIKILHRCGDPQEVVQFAGWRDQPAFSQLIEEEGDDEFILHGRRDVPKTRTAVRMQRVYTVPIEDVQQLSRGAIALITGGLGAWCQVYPLALPPELLHEAAAFVEARPAAQSPNASIPPSPPPASGKTQGRSGPASQGQRKKTPTSSQSQETQRVGTPQPAVSTPTPPPLPSVPPESVESAKANEQKPVVEEDDSPVDF